MKDFQNTSGNKGVNSLDIRNKCATVVQKNAFKKNNVTQSIAQGLRQF